MASNKRSLDVEEVVVLDSDDDVQGVEVLKHDSIEPLPASQNGASTSQASSGSNSNSASTKEQFKHALNAFLYTLKQYLEPENYQKVKGKIEKRTAQLPDDRQWLKYLTDLLNQKANQINTKSLEIFKYVKEVLGELERRQGVRRVQLVPVPEPSKKVKFSDHSATETFKTLGLQLQKRRMKDLEDDILGYLPDDNDLDNDPANKDTELAQKLTESFQTAKKKTDELIDEFARLQGEGSADAEEADEDDSDVESEDGSQTEKTSDGEKESEAAPSLKDVENGENDSSDSDSVCIDLEEESDSSEDEKDSSQF